MLDVAALTAGLGTLTLGLVLTVQTTYVFSQLPGTPVFYKQFAEHLAWTSGNAGCATVPPRTDCRTSATVDCRHHHLRKSDMPRRA